MLSTTIYLKDKSLDLYVAGEIKIHFDSSQFFIGEESELSRSKNIDSQQTKIQSGRSQKEPAGPRIGGLGSI